MKKITIVFFLSLLTVASFSQSVKLEGTVKDTLGKPLEMANVIAFKKGTKFLQSYSITDSKGNYKLSLEQNQAYTLKVSYIGFDTQDVDVTTNSSSEKLEEDIILKESTESLNEVELTYEMPVKIVGDTIVYNTDSFTSGKEKKLEDVLKKLPGIDIDDNGEVEVEGKKVQKVLVEGKEFFDGDSKLATQNIPATAVDKVQVLRNYNEVASMRGVTNNEDNIALNIKLKTGKNKFWFGEVNAGVGDNERYIAKPKLFYYSLEKSINLLADLNNTGETPFTRRDYFRFTGGLRGAIRGSGTSFNVSSGGLGFLTVQNNRAQEIISRFGALNFSLSPKKTLDINGFAIVNDSDTDIFTESAIIYNTPRSVDGVLISNEQSETSALQESKLGMIKFSTTYRPNNDVHVDYDIFGKASEQVEITDVASINRGAVDTQKEEKPFSLNQNFNLYYTINDKNIFSAELQHLYQKDEPLYNSIAETQPFLVIPTSDSENIFDIVQNQKTSTNKFDAKFDYYYLLTPKSNINVSLGTTFSGQILTSGISQNLDNGSVISFNDSVLNNDIDFNFSDIFLGLHYKMVSGIFTFNPGLSLHQYSIKDTQLGTVNKEDKTLLLPDVYARLQFKSSESLRFNYSITSQFSDINSFAEGFILSNYRSLSRGDRNIENSLRHRYSLSYFSFSMFSFTNINASINYTKSVNEIKNNTELIGIDRISFPVNSDFADETLSAFFRYGKTYTKLKTNFRTTITNSIFNNIINDEFVKSRSLSHSYQASIATKFKDAPNIEVGYQKSFNDYSNSNSTTDRPFANMEIGFLKNFILTADYSYYNYKSTFDNSENETNNTYSFLNADLYYQQKDSKWEFKISANNLTNNTSINTDSYNEITDSNSTSIYSVQPRFWMFSVKYNL